MATLRVDKLSRKLLLRNSGRERRILRPKMKEPFEYECRLETSGTVSKLSYQTHAKAAIDKEYIFLT